jgi:hypothetical protein
MDQLTTKSARKKLPIILQTLKANHQQVNIQELFTNNELYDSGGETPQNNNNYLPGTEFHVDSPFETLSITSSSNSTPRRNTKRTANETVAASAAARDELERIGDEEETFVANKKSREASGVSSSGVGSGSRNKQSSVSTEETVVVVRSPAESTNNNKKARRDSAEKFVVSIKKIKKKIYKCQIITTYVQQVFSLDRKVMISSKVLKEEDRDVVIKKREFEDMYGKDKICLAPIDEHLVKFIEN